MIVCVSPLATPSSMIAALTVGRYSDASVLITCSTETIARASGTAAHTCAAAPTASPYCRTPRVLVRHSDAPRRGYKTAGQRRVGLGYAAEAILLAVTSGRDAVSVGESASD